MALNESRQKYYSLNREKIIAYVRRHHAIARVEKPWQTILKNIKKSAERRGLPYELTPQWARESWTGVCALTGLPFDLSSKGGGPKPFSPSVDRIDSAIGYTRENCRIVLWAVNAMRGNGTDADMVRIAEAIVRVYHTEEMQ